jgi:hypothetical protein
MTDNTLWEQITTDAVPLLHREILANGSILPEPTFVPLKPPSKRDHA